MKKNIETWLNDIIKVQKELADKCEELKAEFGIEVCNPGLRESVLFYRGIEKVVETLGLELVEKVNAYDDGTSKFEANYDGVVLGQVGMR